MTDQQARRLILALAFERDGGTFTEGEAGRLLKWAEGVMAEFALLNTVLKGKMLVDVPKRGTNFLFRQVPAAMRLEYDEAIARSEAGQSHERKSR